jgi:hypothetical protein
MLRCNTNILATVIHHYHFSFIVACILLAVVLIAMVYLFVIAPIQLRRDHKKAMEKLDEENDEREPEFVSVGAKVLGKGGFHKYYGTKYVNYTLLLRVAFLTDEGEELVFEIPQEIYDRIEEGQHGNLITVNGNFFDFGDGEEISE